MTDWVPVQNREEYKDLVPLEEYSSDILISKISYTPQCKFYLVSSIFSYFRVFLAASEFSSRGLALCTEAIQLCPGYYSAWHYRRQLISHLSLSPVSELQFVNEISLKNPKNYQIWSYRRELIELSGTYKGELEFLEKIFELDSKNIHAWGYRQWLIIKFQLWDEENEYALRLINQDPYNNSAWNEKIFVSRHNGTFEDASLKSKEIEFVLSHCEETTNECPFNYLRALYSQDFELYIKQRLLKVGKSKGVFVNLVKIFAHFYEIDQNAVLMKACYSVLEQIDERRVRFWAWKREFAVGEGKPKGLDEEILRFLTFKNVMFEYYMTKSQRTINLA